MFIWKSKVKKSELDIQDIVNNAVYLQYLDQARIQYLLSMGINWEDWHNDGLDLLLVHVDMEIKHSLKARDEFYVESTYEKSGRLKIVFHQTIYKLGSNTLVAKAKNTIVCVSLKTGKPVMPDKLLSLLNRD